MPALNRFQQGCIALAISHMIAPDSEAATISVNSNTDPIMSNTDASICTLRNAIVSANQNMAVAGCKAGAGEDTIDFKISGSQTITLTSQLPIIESPILISGVDSPDLTISGNNLHRIFDNQDTLQLESINLIDGQAINNGTSANLYGGAIYSAQFSGLNIVDCSFSSNGATFGGAISNRGTAVIRDSNLIANSATTSGGALRNTGTLRVYDSVISGNSAGSRGGALENRANASIRGTTLAENLALRGGAVHSYLDGNTLTISNSELLSNTASQANPGGGFVSRGGAIYARDSMTTISDTRISQNIARDGGAVLSKNSVVYLSDSNVTSNTALFSGGALSFTDDTQARLIEVTLSSNRANGGRGGAVYGQDSTVNISSSSVLMNNATNSGGGVGLIRGSGDISNTTISQNTTSSNANGGGVYLDSAPLVMLHATVTGNMARYGGGLMSRGTGTVTMTSSIIAGNSATMAASEVGFYSENPAPSSERSLFGSDQVNNQTAFMGFTPDSSDIIASRNGLNLPLDNIIAPLADNGGPTLTHGLPDTSPAIGTGLCTLIRDQRFETRGVNGGCDMGAFELLASDNVQQPAPQTSFFVIPLPNGKSVIVEL